MTKKEILKTTINKIQDIGNKIDEISKLMRELGDFDPLTNISLYYQDIIITLLKKLYNDKAEWIDYYINELEYGAKNDKLKVYDKDDNEIPLTTIDNLIDLLESNL